MNKDNLIQKGLELINVDFNELLAGYEDWKTEVLRYVGDKDEQMVMCLHILDMPYGTKEEKKAKYHSCIKKAINRLSDSSLHVDNELDALEIIINNFRLYLQNMFLTVPENRATLKKDILEQIQIQNEYDLQHMMYAVVKVLYPSARREVNQDTGYGTVRFDIIIDEIDTVIELKCTRADHSESKLFKELGEDAYFYRCSRLIIYVYDKQQKITDVNNFIKALERSKEVADKEVKVYVEQMNQLI